MPSETPRNGAEDDRAVLLALCVTAFMAALNFSATSPFYPDMADDLATTVPLIGQVITVMILISSVLGLAIGPLADRYGFRRPLTIGLIAVGVNLIGTGISPSVPYLFAFSVIGGLADAIVFGLAFAVAGTYFHGPARVKAIGWTAGSLSIAPILGVPILTLIGDVVGWRSALSIGGAIAVAAAWFVWISLPKDQITASLPPLQLRDMIDPYRPVLRHRPTMETYAVNLLRGITWFSMVLYLGAFLEDQVHLETREIGFVYMLSGIGYAVGSFSTRPSLPGTADEDCRYYELVLRSCRRRNGAVCQPVDCAACFADCQLYGLTVRNSANHSLVGTASDRCRYCDGAQRIGAQSERCPFRVDRRVID